MRDRNRTWDERMVAVRRVVDGEKAVVVALDFEVAETTVYAWVRAAGYVQAWVLLDPEKCG